MRNQEIAKGLRLIAEGFTTLAVAYENAPVVVGVDMTSGEDKTVKSTINTTTNEVFKQEVVEPVKEAEEVKEITPVEVKEEAEVTTSFPTEEELNALSYNDLKAKAKEMGVKAVGSKRRRTN